MRDLVSLLLLLLVAAVVFLSGITWGLPTRATDKLLFGNRSPWTGQQIVQLAGPWQPSSQRGADVALNPLERDRTQIVNATDDQRAEIVRRYRLFSYQPDEMITFRALSQMRPSRMELDPRLYQYGGLWIYPVGALIKVVSLLHLASVSNDVAFYLDHPEAFARFYVIARLYCALWGLVGVIVVYLIARKFTPSRVVASACSCAFIFCPAVVNMAHEAKPHLPGAILMLIAIYFAIRFVERGLWRDAIAAGVACGCAFGMVLSALPIFIVLPVMTILRRDKWKHRFSITLASIACGFALYVATNPYVLIHLIGDRTALQSNLANSRAMYHASASSSAIGTAAWLIGEGTSPVMAVIGVAGLLALTWHGLLAREQNSHGLGSGEFSRVVARATMIAIPVVAVLVQFVLLAAGKPGEYGRFALLIDITLAMTAVLTIARFLPAKKIFVPVLALMLAIQAWHASYYVRGFVADSSRINSRLATASWIANSKSPDNDRLYIDAEPAPYNMPPVDLFHWKLVLPARGKELANNEWTASVRLIDWQRVTPMSWANIYFQTALNPAPPLTAHR